MTGIYKHFQFFSYKNPMLSLFYFVLDFFQTCSMIPSHHKTLLPGVVTSCEIATKSDQPLARSQSTICSWQQKSYQSEKPPQIKCRTDPKVMLISLLYKLSLRCACIGMFLRYVAKLFFSYTKKERFKFRDYLSVIELEIHCLPMLLF